MDKGLKKQVVTGVAWKYAERMLAQIISTVVAIVLARILDPAHYGIISIVNVFITICNVFVVCGLGESLVQKKDADELDFSSIFYINVGLSIILYLILFICAPMIERFYGDSYSDLALIIRIMGLRLILAAVNSIQNARVSREMDFKKYFWVTLFGTLLSAFVGIYMAVSGFGVWALVAQYMTNSTVDTVMLFIFVKWRPHLMFSLKRAKPLIKYGSRIVAVSAIDTVYDELRSLIIGKKYSADDLAFYTKGETYPKLVVNNFNSALASVLFPAFSKVQDDREAMKRLLKRSITTSSYIIFPAMIGLFVVAEQFVSVLLTDKWLPCVPYLRMMCVVFMLKPMAQPSNQCLTASGNSGLYAKTGLIKKVFGVALLLLSFKYGVIWIAVTQVISNIFDYVVSVITGGRIIQYGIKQQLRDLMPHFIMAVIMGGVVWCVGKLLNGCQSLYILIIEILVGIIVYIVASVITKDETFFMFFRVIRKKRKK